MNRLTRFDNGKWRMDINDTEYTGPKIDYYGITCESEGENED